MPKWWNGRHARLRGVWGDPWGFKSPLRHSIFREEGHTRRAPVPVNTPLARVAVVGATGYTGGELLRLLAQHPRIEVTAVTSEQSAGRPLSEKLPFLQKCYSLTLSSFDPASVAEQADAVFMAVGHTQAMTSARLLLDAGKKVVDLSADFRLRSAALYEKWYGTPHLQPALLKRAVYGLTELHRKKIAHADLVANPGCYPTGALLPIHPYLVHGVVDRQRAVIIDAKSGVSGAGRSPSATTHFPEIHEGFSAYNVGTHRHLPEIEQEMARIQKVKALFTPHLLPVNRGILTTIYLPLTRALSQKKMEAILDTAYADAPFIRRVAGSPNLTSVRGSNFCDIAVFAAGRYAILISAIDNLVKGAAGQAIQNLNVMMGWEETLGLATPGLFP